MEHKSDRAQAFLRSLDPEGLKVGDGSDHLPVWIGIDAEAGKVYKVFASGLATGFGDGVMQIRSGIGDPGHRFVEQTTNGPHLMLDTGLEPGKKGLALMFMELDAVDPALPAHQPT